jgi:DNA-binding NtrC family response regulator
MRAARKPLEQVRPLLSRSVIEALCHYEWPGNVRELANAMEYAWIVSGGQDLRPEHLPAHIRAGRSAPVSTPPSRPATATTLPLPSHATPIGGSLAEVEMQHILRVLEKHQGHKAHAAAELGISLKTLYNKLNRYEEEHRAAG